MTVLGSQELDRPGRMSRSHNKQETDSTLKGGETSVVQRRLSRMHGRAVGLLDRV